MSQPSPPPPPRLTPTTTNRFEKDVKRLRKRGEDMIRLSAVIEALCSHAGLAPRHRDHALVGDWQGWRDCHVGPDWLLIYRVEEGELILGRTGTHSDLFS